MFATLLFSDFLSGLLSKHGNVSITNSGETYQDDHPHGVVWKYGCS